MMMAVRRLYLLFLGCLIWSAVHCYYTTESNEYETTYPPSSLQNQDDGYNCSFTYGLCGWSQAVSDVFDWTLHSGSTPSSGTGPNGDHTTYYGKYLYIETSSPRHPSDYARLQSAYIDMGFGAKCFSFWYNMNGASIGRLNIYTRQAGQLNKIWTLSGNQGPSWHQAHTNIYGNGQIQLIIEAYVGSSYYGDIAIDDTELIGGTCPDSYEQTTYNPWNQQTSDYYQGGTRVRLEGGNYHSGRVAIYHNGQWGTICDDGFDHDDAKVVCRMLGLNQGDRYGVAYSGSSRFGPGSGQILLDDVNCYGYETDISSCSSSGWYNHDCSHTEDVAVDCYAPYNEHTTPAYTRGMEYSTDRYSGISVRLVNGPNSHSGRVQVRRDGAWGTVCDDDFDHNDVMVICRMLGMYAGERYGVAYPSAHFGQGSGSIFLDDLGCNGYEKNLDSCSSRGWGHENCDHSEDAGLDCYANYQLTTEYPWWIHQTSAQADITVRLVGGNYYSGRVEVYYNGQWGTICDDGFDHNDVKVICRMLNLYQGESYGIAYSQAYYGSGTGKIIIDELNCYGYEADINLCPSQPWYRNDCSHREDAGVNCYAYYQEITTPSYTTYPWRLSTRYFTTYSTSFPWWATTYNPWRTTTYNPWRTTTYNPWRTTTYNPWWTHYTTYGYKLQDAMVVNCNEYTWNIKVDMDRLRQIYPDAKGSDIYLGENKCTGIERNGHLTFQHGLTECLTSETLQNGVHVYNNELIYAEHDPVYLFIIRHYNWTVGVECDVRRDGSVAGVVNNNEANTISPSVSSQQYPVNMSFYLDPNFMKEVSGTPLHADVGEHVYVKVFTTTFDWNARMRVHTCYTKPTPYSPDHMKYYLIKNGCEVDTNTHIISQSTHETRFIFDQFEYTSNHDGIYVFCDTIFCHSSDYSARCRQTCNPVIRRKVAVEKIQADDNVEDADSKL